MQQMCPRCHEQQVGKSGTSSIVRRQLGLLGLLTNSFTSYSCPTCGKIPLSEFPEEFQSSVKKKRILAALGIVAVFALIVALLLVKGAANIY